MWMENDLNFVNEDDYMRSIDYAYVLLRSRDDGLILRYCINVD